MSSKFNNRLTKLEVQPSRTFSCDLESAETLPLFYRPERPGCFHSTKNSGTVSI